MKNNFKTTGRDFGYRSSYVAGADILCLQSSFWGEMFLYANMQSEKSNLRCTYTVISALDHAIP